MATEFITVSIDVMHNKDFNQSQKFIYSEIKQLHQLDHGCFASNEHFAELIGITKENVSKNLRDLESKGYISIVIKNGSRNRGRKITLIKTVSLTKTVFDPYQSSISPLSKQQETKDNKTINKTINKTLVPTNVSERLYFKFLEFYDFRKKIKKPFKTSRPFESMVEKIGKDFVNEDHLIQCIDFAMDHEYQGVRGEYVKYEPKAKTYRTPEERRYYQALELKKKDPDQVSDEWVESKREDMIKSLKGAL